MSSQQAVPKLTQLTLAGDSAVVLEEQCGQSWPSPRASGSLGWNGVMVHPAGKGPDLEFACQSVGLGVQQ